MRKPLIVALGLLLIALFACYAAGILKAGAVDSAAVRYCEMVAGFPIDGCMRAIGER